MTNGLGKDCMAAIALFGELAKMKMDVYQTLSTFIKYIIYNEKCSYFSVSDIVVYLSEYFDFNIPEIVVKNALSKIPELSLSNRKYSLKQNISIDIDIEKKKDEIERSQTDISSALFEYIQQKAKRSIDQNEKDKISNILYEYLVYDKIPQDYWGKYIHSFIIVNNNNNRLISSLRLIKEGALLYSAFQYTPNEYSTNTWDYETVFYFDTELLFSLYGFNGDLYKKIVIELINLIQAVNKSSKKKIGRNIIQLKYFCEIRTEIDSFFGSAERIVDENRRKFQAKSAMQSIINKCTEPSDIRAKKGMFWAYIDSLNIKCDTSDDYLPEENHKYNLLSLENIQQTADKYSQYSQEEIEMNMSILNKINILRKGKNNSIREAKFFFLTATNLCLNLANEKDEMRNGAVPLASTCEYFIDKIWVKTNRNFANITIKSLDVVARAQIVISSILNLSIDKKIKEVEEKYNSNGITREQAEAALVEIRKIKTNSDQIGKDNIEPILMFTEEGLDAYIDNHDYQLKQAQISENENKKLREESEEKDRKIRQYEEKEAKRVKAKEKRKRILVLVGFTLLACVLLITNYFLTVKQIDNVCLRFLSRVFAVISFVVGILGYFKIDFDKIHGWVRKS
jgi:hypothetical protein